jgi:DNA modification methylase
MKKNIFLVCLLFLVMGCHTTTVEKPNNLIDKDKMIDILYDMSLLEAIKTQNINGGMTNKAANEYIYKKYKIDSVQFVKSNKYYASNLDEYKKMFEKIKERLNNEITKIDEELKKKGQAVPPNQNSTSNSDTPQVQ